MQSGKFDVSTWRRPVVFHINGYGDRLMATPALRALVHLFGRSLRILCARGDGATMLSSVRGATFVEIDARHVTNGWTFDADEAASAVGDCDLFLSLNPWDDPAADRLQKLLAPTHTVGFNAKFATRLSRYADRHAVDEAFELPRLFDPRLSVDCFSGPPSFGAEAERDADEIMCQLLGDRRILAVQTETNPAKSWPAEDLAAILDVFLEECDDFIALVVDKFGHGLDGGPRGSRVIPCYHLPLATAMAIVARSTLFLGVDSCMLHVADLARVPGVAMFSSTNAKRFGFRFTPGVHVHPERRLTAGAAREIALRLVGLAGKVCLG
jgi:hypothetical protein